MRHRLRLVIIVIVVMGFSLVGLTRLRFETDILEVLPQNLPSVEALKVSQKYFKNDQQVILLLESRTEEIHEEDVAEFAATLREKLAPAKVLYKSELEENPESFAGALAEIWRYAPPADVAQLVDRLLNPKSLVDHLDEVKSEIRRSFDQQESTMAAYDPIGFLQHPAMRQFIDSEFSFQSDDGKSQIILITNPHPVSDYKAHAEWIRKIRQSAQSWPGLEQLGLSFRLTGGPVFNAEIGAGMEKDMSGTIMLTSILIGALFLIVQRHPGQLLMVSLQLGMIFLITLGTGGWIYGNLNLVSVGFAAILLGLAVDYAVVIARESIGGFTSAGSLRRELAPGILWAAATTAIVFGLLTLSTFTGVRQLGGLIVIGLIVGATVMLVFTPMFLSRFPCGDAKLLLKSPFPSRWVARAVIAVGLLTAVISFASKGAPRISFDFSMVEPSSSEAAATFEAIQKEFPALSEKNIQLIASARSWDELRKVAGAADAKLQQARKQGVISEYQWPIDLIPNRAFSETNRESLERISAGREQIVATLKSKGFSESGVALDSMVLESLAGPGGLGEIGKLAGNFLSAPEDGNYYLSGMIKTREVITDRNITNLASLTDGNFTVTGWSILKAALLPSVKRDFYVIFLPAAAALLLTLVAVFRSVRDAAIAIIVLVTVLALVNAFLVVTGQAWNFLSGMAIPLIIGSGVDYSIHLIFSLRRWEGDFDKVWNGAGKAICFCGLSTAFGFGSLLFASNEMLKSMGLVCSLGVLLTTILSVLVVPGLWKRSRH